MLTGCCWGLDVYILLLISLNHMLDIMLTIMLHMLASYSLDPQLNTVVESGDLARLQEDRSSR